MITRKTFKATALASVCMVPLAAAAAAAADDTGFDLPEAMPNTQELKRISAEKPTLDNEVTVGIQGQSSTSAVFGRYNGMLDEGPKAMGSWSLNGRGDWKGEDTYFYKFTGQDLKFGYGGKFDIAPNSSIGLRVGNQGTWELNAGYDAMTYVQSNNFTTFFDKNGTLLNGVTPVPSNNATPVARSFSVADVVGTRRDKGSVGLKYLLGDWTLTTGLIHEHKEGTMEQSLTVAGSNAGIATFPMPINYDTDRFNAGAGFSTPKLQANISYAFSNFKDNNTAFQFQAYELRNGLATAPMAGVYSLPPSNMAHQLSGQVGYNLTDTTRINANVTYGIQMQDQGFVPGTQDPAAGGLANWSNNPSSLQGFVQTLFGNVAITTRPFTNSDLKVSYTIDDRQSNTPAQNMIIGDPTDTNGVKFRTAIAPSWLKQTAAIEGGYRILPSTRVSLGYAYRDVTRTETIIHKTVENEITGKVRTTFTPDVTGSIGYSHSWREVSAPDYSVWSRVGPGSDCQNAATPACLAIPAYQAARIQDAITNRVNWTAGQDTTLGFMAKVTNNTYPDQPKGVIGDYGITSGPDLTYRFGPDAEAHTFYTYQRRYREMNGLPSYTNNVANDTHTMGLNGSWQATEDLKIGSDYIVSYGVEAFNQGGTFSYSRGAQQSGDGSLPNVTSLLNSFKLHADYDFTPGMTLHLGYGYDRLVTSDWAMFGIVANQVLTGEVNPSYAVHSAYTSVSFKW